MKKHKVIALTSGGLDSSVMLASLKASGHEVLSIAFDYGQRHRIELDCASWQAGFNSVPFTLVDMHFMARLIPGNALTDKTVNVPQTHSENEAKHSTVVPNRNMIMMSLAVAHGIAMGCDAVAYATHADDFAGYPDCRPEFVDAMNKAFQLCHWEPIELLSPLVHMSKAQIVEHGIELGVDFSHTYSCYKGGELHCGRCPTCLQRREAFHRCGATDPTQYEMCAPSLERLIACSFQLEE